MDFLVLIWKVNSKALLGLFYCKDPPKSFENTQHFFLHYQIKKICTIIILYCYIEFATSLYSMCINIFTQLPPILNSKCLDFLQLQQPSSTSLFDGKISCLLLINGCQMIAIWNDPLLDLHTQCTFHNGQKRLKKVERLKVLAFWRGFEKPKNKS